MNRVTPYSLVSDILTRLPGSVAVFERHGLGCPSCLAAGMDTLSSVASMHDVSLDALIADLALLDTEDTSHRKEQA